MQVAVVVFKRELHSNELQQVEVDRYLSDHYLTDVVVLEYQRKDNKEVKLYMSLSDVKSKYNVFDILEEMMFP